MKSCMYLWEVDQVNMWGVARPIGAAELYVGFLIRLELLAGFIFAWV